MLSHSNSIGILYLRYLCWKQSVPEKHKKNNMQIVPWRPRWLSAPGMDVQRPAVKKIAPAAEIRRAD